MSQVFERQGPDLKEFVFKFIHNAVGTPFYFTRTAIVLHTLGFSLTEQFENKKPLKVRSN